MEIERKYLFFLTKNYSYSILKPLYDEARKNSKINTFWFSTKSQHFDIPSEKWLMSNSDVLNFKPDVIFAPGNIVPAHWPGLKVQIFHGLGEEKQGHYRMNGLFHMYCTPGPFITDKFVKRNRKNKYIIAETGWPKIDTIFKDQKSNNVLFNNDLQTILYAPTFSKKLTSAYDLIESIKKLQKRNYNWIIKFHELMDTRVVNDYKKMETENFVVSEKNDILPLMSESDMLITDTSSVAYEYLFYNKPIVSYKAKTRIDKGINILEPDNLEGAILRGFSDPDEYKDNREFYISELHPYTDGLSSKRIIEAVDKVLANGYKPQNKFNFTYQLNKWKTKNLVS